MQFLLSNMNVSSCIALALTIFHVPSRATTAPLQRSRLDANLVLGPSFRNSRCLTFLRPGHRPKTSKHQEQQLLMKRHACPTHPTQVCFKERDGNRLHGHLQSELPGTLLRPESHMTKCLYSAVICSRTLGVFALYHKLIVIAS